MFRLLILIFLSLNITAADWTWSYRKRFSREAAQSHHGKAHATFSKTATPKYKQLIFSWNAHRPQSGYFTFYVQSRDAISKEWSPWYKMVEWGSAVQKSHYVRRDGYGAYHYVRLEQPKNSSADGFRLKVEAHGQADLTNLQALSVCISDLDKFRSESVSGFSSLPSVQVMRVPKQSQMALRHEDRKKMCSPTSTSMLVGYLSGGKVSAIDFAKNTYDHGLGAYGSWPFNTAHAFELYPKFFYRVLRLKSFSDLHTYLKRHLPVVVSVRGQIEGAPQDYSKGHLITIVGWDQKRMKVICHDPAVRHSGSVKRSYKIGSFLKAWERSRHLAYVVERR